jgi:hypothetical protein
MLECIPSRWFDREQGKALDEVVGKKANSCEAERRGDEKTERLEDPTTTTGRARRGPGVCAWDRVCGL